MPRCAAGCLALGSDNMCQHRAEGPTPRGDEAHRGWPFTTQLLTGTIQQAQQTAGQGARLTLRADRSEVFAVLHAVLLWR